MEYILTSKNLGKKYGKHQVLHDLNIQVKKGDIYGLIGRNGAGKTTLIRILCGLQSPSEGAYSLYGVENKDPKILNSRKRINAIVEKSAMYTGLSAKDNLIAQYKLIGLPSYEDIPNLLKLVGLEDVGKKKVKYFSLGMKQRLGIALCLASNPDFIILDEPINGLDPEGIIDIRELILKLNKEKEITFLISSHYLDELSKIATCYGFLEKGHMLKEIDAKELDNVKNKKLILKIDHLEEAIKYLEKESIHYKIKDKETLIIDKNIDITKMVLTLKDLNIKEIKEIEETLENYYLNLIGEHDYDKNHKI